LRFHEWQSKEVYPRDGKLTAATHIGMLKPSVVSCLARATETSSCDSSSFACGRLFIRVWLHSYHTPHFVSKSFSNAVANGSNANTNFEPRL
jgi:hypothetical protein